MKSAALILALFTLLATSALAQVPDQYTNLKVLPKDIGKRELLGTMKSFARANVDKALALDPQSGHAQRMLKQLEQ